MDNPTRLVAAAVDVFNRIGNLDQTIAMIEAAPELLKALRGVMETDAVCEDDDNPGEGTPYDAARAAIAKTQ